jgi:thiopeptide-type bacteriocin biosynthesis protein
MTQEWLFYSLYPGTSEALDATVGELVAPAVARAGRAAGIDRWFFLRYTDELGPHVRLRFRGAPDAVDRLEAALTPQLADGLAGVASAAGGHVGCHQDIYEPEYDKFGGPDGLAAAERAFEASSALGLVCAARPALAISETRRTLGLWLMERTATDHLERAAAEDLWRYAWWYWSGGEGAAAATRRQRAATNAAASDFTTDLAHDPGLTRALGRYLAAVSEALPGRRNPRARARQCFQHIHLTANRLGLAIADEAALGAALCRVHSVAARESFA